MCVSEDKDEMLFFLPHRQTRDGNVEPLGLLDTSQPPLRLQTAHTPSVASSSDRTQTESVSQVQTNLTTQKILNWFKSTPK